MMETEESNSLPPEEEQALPPTGTSFEVKSLVQELLKNGFIESVADSARFNAVIRCHRDIDSALEPLDLRLDVDELRGLAVLRVVDSAAATPDESWSHPLVRRQRLTLEQSLVVAILRQFHVMHELESGIGVREVRISVDELLSQLQVFLTDTGSDARNRQRLLTLLDQLKPHGIVSEPDPRGEVTIRPLITRLANPETLAALLKHFREMGKKPEVAITPIADE
jgi:hypothetical protein